MSVTEHQTRTVDIWRLTELLEAMRYWRDQSVCVCGCTTPIGGCLRCDMQRGILTIEVLLGYITTPGH